MPHVPSARTLATVAALAGTGLLGAAVGGMASVDRELAASAPKLPAAHFDRVVYVPAAEGVAREDCLPRVRTTHVRPEL